jgi:hypothetical protein
LSGHDSTLAKKSAQWRTLITYFGDRNAIDASMHLCCYRHTERPLFALMGTDASLFKPSHVCYYPSEEVLPCDHVCSLTCHSRDRRRCKEPVSSTFSPRGHSETRMCNEDEEILSCNTKIMHKFGKYDHSTEKECSEVKGTRNFQVKRQVL